MRDECCLSTRPHTFVFIWCCMFPPLIELYKPHNYTQFLRSCSVHLLWAPLIRCLQILRQPPMFLLSALVANMASPFWFGVTTSTAWEPVWPKKTAAHQRSGELNDPWIGRLMQFLKHTRRVIRLFDFFFKVAFTCIYHPGQCLGQNLLETTSIWGEFTLKKSLKLAKPKIHWRSVYLRWFFGSHLWMGDARHDGHNKHQIGVAACAKIMF